MIVMTHAALGLLPIVPILLLPFALVFFVVVFPLWGVALAFTGLALLIARLLDWLARLAGSNAMADLPIGARKVFRWILTFGGFVKLDEGNK